MIISKKKMRFIFLIAMSILCYATTTHASSPRLYTPPTKRRFLGFNDTTPSYQVSLGGGDDTINSLEHNIHMLANATIRQQADRQIYWQAHLDSLIDAHCAMLCEGLQEADLILQPIPTLALACALPKPRLQHRITQSIVWAARHPETEALDKEININLISRTTHENIHGQEMVILDFASINHLSNYYAISQLIISYIMCAKNPLCLALRNLKTSIEDTPYLIFSKNITTIYLSANPELTQQPRFCTPRLKTLFCCNNQILTSLTPALIAPNLENLVVCNNQSLLSFSIICTPRLKELRVHNNNRLASFGSLAHPFFPPLDNVSIINNPLLRDITTHQEFRQSFWLYDHALQHGGTAVAASAGTSEHPQELCDVETL